jgi:hypothetical protein
MRWKETKKQKADGKNIFIALHINHRSFLASAIYKPAHDRPGELEEPLTLKTRRIEGLLRSGIV